MLQAYKEGKDLYSVIAQLMYNNKYEDNLEFYPKNTIIEVNGEKVVCGDKTHLNKQGKKRRKEAKTVLLGLLYGRGANSIAAQLDKPKEEGQKIIDTFFKSFPKVKNWVDGTHNKVRRLGWVEDWYGRRRHLPDVSLPQYTIRYTNDYIKNHTMFNPFLICNSEPDNTLLNKYKSALAKRVTRDKFNIIKSNAIKEGVDVINNNGFIARAERQSVNAIVQGGAATLTKMAMINIYNDKELNELGLKMLVPIHDELLCTCPKINVEKAAKRLVQVMVDTPKKFMNVPMSCDPYIVTHWYYDELTVQVQNDFKHLTDEMPREQAIEEIKKLHCELLEEDLLKMLDINE